MNALDYWYQKYIKLRKIKKDYEKALKNTSDKDNTNRVYFEIILREIQ
jgi:hypothetical protein